MIYSKLVHQFIRGACVYLDIVVAAVEIRQIHNTNRYMRVLNGKLWNDLHNYFFFFQKS